MKENSIASPEPTTRSPLSLVLARGQSMYRCCDGAATRTLVLIRRTTALGTIPACQRDESALELVSTLALSNRSCQSIMCSGSIVDTVMFL